MDIYTEEGNEMSALPDKLSKTYWARQRQEETEYLAGLTGMTPDEVERDLSQPDVHGLEE